MALYGFEGFEKRLELHFSGDDPTAGLRQLDFSAIQEVLDAVQCSVVSAIGNQFFDAYVLSESSLFVYPNKIIIKTCGTTQLLKSIPCLLRHASDLGLSVCGCKYTRGSFIFPQVQPFPHTSFREEVVYLEESLPSYLCYRKACVLPSKTSHSWHVYSACDDHHHKVDHDLPNMFTMEVCMTQLDPALALRFFWSNTGCNSGDVSGKEMTNSTGIAEINPRAIVCDFGFDPCGYSMNGIDGPRYSTIHVTPEDGYSYASFECVGSADGHDEIGEVLKKVASIFRPATMSVSICECFQNGGDEGVWLQVADALEPIGLKCRSCTVEGFPVTGSVVFQTFTMTRRK